VQIISLFHHPRYIIYSLLPNVQQFKGPSRRKFRTPSTKMEFKCCTIEVKCPLWNLLLSDKKGWKCTRTTLSCWSAKGWMNPFSRPQITFIPLHHTGGQISSLHILLWNQNLNMS